MFDRENFSLYGIHEVVVMKVLLIMSDYHGHEYVNIQTWIYYAALSNFLSFWKWRLDNIKLQATPKSFIKPSTDVL